MNAEHLAKRDQGDAVCHMRAPFSVDRLAQADGCDDISIDDFVSFGIVVFGMRRTAQLGVEWLLTKRQERS